METKLSILQGSISEFTPTKIHKLFENGLIEYADREALIFEENGYTRKHTFREVNNLAERLAKIILNRVAKNNLYQEDDKNFIIGVHMHASDYLVITLLAIWKAGAAYLPLDPSYPTDRIEYIVSDTKLALVIYDKEDGTFPNTYKLCINGLNLEDEDSRQLSDIPKPIVEDSDLAIVLYTSGSTGFPKGVCLCHTALLNRLSWQYKYFPFKETEKTGVFKTVLSFVDSIFEVWGPFLKGLSVLVVPKPVTQNPEKLIESLEKYEIHRMVLVPTLLEAIILYKQISGKKTVLPKLNLWICSGEILSKALTDKFYNHFETEINMVCNYYGSTEVIDFTYHAITHPKHLEKYGSFPIGKAVDNMEVYVLDSNKTILPEGEVGEIYASGLSLPLKYLSKHGNEDKMVSNFLSSNKMFSKMCKMGDCGQIKDGLLFYLGRTDSVIKIRGFRVDLVEIEKVINVIEGVTKSVVLCYNLGEVNQTIVAFVQTAGEVSELEISEILKDKLPSQMLPTVVCIEQFPVLINGKVDRQKLLEQYADNQNKNESDYTGVTEEKMPVARVLFETVSQVIGRVNCKISLNSNFFAIGGNSINAIYTINSLKDKGFHIGIKEFILSKDFEEVICRMVDADRTNITVTEEPEDFILEEMEERHKDTVLKILADSFVEKSSVDTLLESVTREEYRELLGHHFPVALESGLSFVVKSKDGTIIAASLNYNADAKLNYTLNSLLPIVDDFYYFIENPIKVKLLKEYKKIFYAYVLGTSETLTPQENVLVVHFIEQQILKQAKRKNYEGILTSNQTEITEDIAKMYGYSTCLEYQINQYVASDNSRPFAKAPDSQRVVINFKKL